MNEYEKFKNEVKQINEEVKKRNDPFLISIESAGKAEREKENNHPLVIPEGGFVPVGKLIEIKIKRSKKNKKLNLEMRVLMNPLLYLRKI